MWYTHTIKYYLANEKEWSIDSCYTWMNLENIIKRPVTKDYILSNSIYMNAQLNILKSIELYILPVCKFSLNKAIPPAPPPPDFFLCKSVKLFLKTVRCRARGVLTSETVWSFLGMSFRVIPQGLLRHVIQTYHIWYSEDSLKRSPQGI